jgi:thiamine pyrophosphate-dependent acetolactate synthase large subunit-like protein
MKPINGAMKLVNTLITKGVKDIFGYPGGAILPVLDALAQKPESIKYYLSRTEQGGGFMADGYANATGKLGVVMTTSGPGALNVITCLQNALSDGTPMLALTGQVSTAVLGTDAFQEADVIGISKPCTKWNAMIRAGGDIEGSVDCALSVAFHKRPGPVLLDLPKNIMSGEFYASTPVFSKPLAFGYNDKKATVDCDKNYKNDIGCRKTTNFSGAGCITSWTIGCSAFAHTFKTIQYSSNNYFDGFGGI